MELLNHKSLVQCFIEGVKSITLPSIKNSKFEPEHFYTSSDYSRLKKDYVRSTQALRKEVVNFEQHKYRG